MPKSRGFIVRDLRKKEKFFIDDSYLNSWAKYLTPSTTSVYISLCRHADKNQNCFPSQKLIAKEHGMGERTVRGKIAVLKALRIIGVKRDRNKKGRWYRNSYFLLDKSQWLSPKAVVASGQSRGKKRPLVRRKSRGRQNPIKDTHIYKDTQEFTPSVSGIKKLRETVNKISPKYA